MSDNDYTCPDCLGDKPPNACACALHKAERERDDARAEALKWMARCHTADSEGSMAVDAIRRERDAEWARALDPKNVGTDYGAFLSDPERARMLIQEERILSKSERDAEWVRAVWEVKAQSGVMWREPECHDLRRGAEIRCDEILRRMGVEVE